MEDTHTNDGKISIFCGIFAIVLLLTLSGGIIGIIQLGLMFAAIIYGIKARKQGDIFGTYGIILGVLSFVLTILISAIIYMWITGY